MGKNDNFICRWLEWSTLIFSLNSKSPSEKRTRKSVPQFMCSPRWMGITVEVFPERGTLTIYQAFVKKLATSLYRFSFLWGKKRERERNGKVRKLLLYFDGRCLSKKDVYGRRLIGNDLNSMFSGEWNLGMRGLWIQQVCNLKYVHISDFT